MAEHEGQADGTLRVAAAAANEIEADLMSQRLAEEGIPAISQRAMGSAEWGTSGGRYVYVEAEHLERAKQILSEPGGPDEDELAQMAEEAAPPAATMSPNASQAGRRAWWQRLMHRRKGPGQP